MYYAQITNGVVTAVTQTTAVVIAPDMIEISGLLDIGGYIYNAVTGEFTPPPAPPAPVPTVTALQGLLALDAAGLGPTYDAWASDPARTFAERAFINKAQNWLRDDPALAAAAEAFGLSSEDIDNLFALAAAQVV